MTGPLMLDLRGPTLADDELELLQRDCVGGVILFTRNYRSLEQLRELTSAIRQCAPDLLIAADQEGGRVQRFRDGFEPLPPLRGIGEVYEADAGKGLALARDCGWVMATEIVKAGLDFSFAPVLDLFDPASPVIGDRAFSADPETVSHLARAYIAGMSRAGMAAVGKHFPGHGAVSADSHVELPVDTRDGEELRRRDLLPFLSCREMLAGIIPAHVIYRAVCSETAGFSSYWLKTVLRGEIGFEGVIFSDDLSMTAAHVAGAIERRLERALAAGCDMLLVCNAPEDALRAAEWLEREKIPGNGALQSMRARPAPAPDDEAWQRALDGIRGLRSGTRRSSGVDSESADAPGEPFG